MSSITAAFAEALETVRRPDAFFVAGSQQMLAPGLEVEGVGPIGLPLPAIQAEQLIAAAERAPYGRGAETVTDITVRRTWQIGADRVSVRGKHWPETLQAIVARVTEGLGIADPVDAELYKLLVYDQGSFFVPHRDTEKSPGMFATLVLALPSASQGGALIVRHKDREARIDLACDDPSEVAFAAFYADCVHEVLPVVSGYRLVLVYNLVRRGSGPTPEMPDYSGEVAAVSDRLTQWADALRAGDAGEPLKLIYLLEHAYTPAELNFTALKGADAGIAQVAVAAAQRARCSVHLALVSVEESGIAQATGDYYVSRRGRYHEDDDEEEEVEEFEVVEVSERHALASHWRRPDGEISPLTDLPLNEEELSPPVSFDEMEPDEEHFQEATGNEGASYERTYRRTGLILWPEDQLLGVINQGGLKVTLPFLEDLATRWANGGDPATRAQAAELSQRMIAEWPMSQWYQTRNSERSDVGRFLHLLVGLDDAARIEAFLIKLTGRRGFDIGDATDIADALRVLAAERAGALAHDLIEQAAERALAACGALLVRITEWNPAVAMRAARILVGALPGNVARAVPLESWNTGPGVRPAFIVDLLTALGRIDATLAAVAVEHILGSSASYDFDAVLTPAVLALLDAGLVAEQPAIQRLRAACAAHLDQRIALALEPPPDWQRDASVGCSCSDCRTLARFLADGTQRDWVFAAAQSRRSHVEATIRSDKCDVDFRTEKRGSPHRLVCTKNQASYLRRCEQRKTDLADRARLGAQAS